MRPGLWWAVFVLAVALFVLTDWTDLAVVLAVGSLLILALGAVGPPQYRCDACSAVFPDFGLLVAHEDGHKHGWGEDFRG